jgi:uncharacterized protein (TIGR00730 family)
MPRNQPEHSGTPKPPAHPFKRHQQLPGQTPKPAEDDPDAPRRVQAIMASPSYAEADQDPAFLHHPVSRGVRLQMDYLKAELALLRFGVENTIVVFGSTRIREAGAAQRQVDALAAQLQAAPNDADLKQRLEAAKRLLAKSHYYDIAREFGKLVGKAGEQPEDCRITLVTGGGPGMMEAANRGAFDVNAKSIGLNISLPQEQYPNPYITPDLCFQFHYFAIRKLHFMQRARALVVFPGGFGTCDELFETLALVQTRKMPPVPIVLVGEAYWRQALNIDFLLEEGVIDVEDRDLFWYAESANQIWDSILRWHEANGTPLLPARTA